MFVNIKTADQLLQETLTNARQQKREEIRAAFAAASTQPVASPLGGSPLIYWHGGYDSAQKLDGARRLAMEVGDTEVTFYDINNTAHVLTTADARTIILTISNKFQQDFARKQSLMTAIDDATSLTEIQEIIW